MKKLFDAVRGGDLVGVKAMLASKPELLFCTAKQPPKKDDGQSLLQVAIKTGNFDIADFLLDLGADVNFVEKQSCNAWKAPVVHDAIKAAVLSARYNIVQSFDGGKVEYFNSMQKADTAFGLLRKMLDLGADINSLDSYGNSCLVRAILDARQILPQYIHSQNRLSDNRLITDELKRDLAQIFDLLIARGANIYETDRISHEPLSEYYAHEPVAQFVWKKH